MVSLTLEGLLIAVIGHGVKLSFSAVIWSVCY